jgi:hypothetical protein
MKITENIEVKANKIVFDRETVYELESKTDTDPGMWRRAVSKRKTDVGLITNQDMAHKMMCIANTDRYRMRIDEKTLNIYTRQKERKQKCRCGNLNCMRHNE